jgi:hypothetical protein
VLKTVQLITSVNFQMLFQIPRFAKRLGAQGTAVRLFTSVNFKVFLQEARLSKRLAT